MSSVTDVQNNKIRIREDRPFTTFEIRKEFLLTKKDIIEEKIDTIKEELKDNTKITASGIEELSDADIVARRQLIKKLATEIYLIKKELGENVPPFSEYLDKASKTVATIGIDLFSLVGIEATNNLFEGKPLSDEETNKEAVI